MGLTVLNISIPSSINLSERCFRLCISDSIIIDHKVPYSDQALCHWLTPPFDLLLRIYRGIFLACSTSQYITVDSSECTMSPSNQESAETYLS